MRHSTSKLRCGSADCACALKADPTAQTAPIAITTTTDALVLPTMVTCLQIRILLIIMVLRTNAGKCGVAPALFHGLKSPHCTMLKS
ncbi:hypothetical protein [Aquabacterium sp.]|uniref:hypothetical protein n=1 Tax=Aquabacterium sp. TaxID=1872578 RepID=UPI0019A3CA69|nr:hypothetical protein [Aquabacterium sp.]MBC7700497.1 hypothetical protein [Aquabacterium sp.]